ncbi:MAG: hypothetical protein MR031_06135 [Tenericutes bacterium]|nr:hypothetical protein [Mycoplasmatota bacterium]
MKKIDQVLMVDAGNLFIPSTYGIVFYKDGTHEYMNYEDLVGTLHRYTKWFSFESRNLEMQTVLKEELRNRNPRLNEELNKFVMKDSSIKDKKARLIEKEMDLNLGMLVNLYSYHSLKRNKMESLPEKLDGLIDRCFKMASNECKKCGIDYRENTEEIVSDILGKIEDENEDDLVKEDFAFCTSREKVFQEYDASIGRSTDEHDIGRVAHRFRFIRLGYLATYTASFLGKRSDFLLALVDDNYPNRETILNNWTEFFYVCRDYFGIIDAVDQCIRDAEQLQVDMEVTRLESNEKFMGDVDDLLSHDTDEETYYFHATNSRSSAQNILDKGLYMFDRDLGTTTFPELDKDDVLTYEYGSGFGNNATYIVVLRKKDGEEIVRNTSPEEKKESMGVARRLALAPQGCDYIVDPENIVGFVDRNREEVVFNDKVKKETRIKEAKI